MLFAARFLPGLADGSITLTYRRWRGPKVRVGSRHRVPGGVIVVDAVAVVTPADVGDEDARRAGFASRADLLAELGGEPGGLYRVAFHWDGADPRVELARRGPTDAERSDILARLARLDAASRHGPWTSAVLLLIGQFPGTRSADLAATIKREPKSFKADVAKLKELGLTESLEVGYRLSHRGRALLSQLPPGR